jgi:hypothetical protein
MKNVILICLIFAPFVIMAQEQKMKWDYPIKPGTKEWVAAAFKTGRARIDACQIPQNVLNQLSSQELAELCINYPLYIDYLASDDQRRGIKFMIESFNGLKELAKRKDGTQALINVYQHYPVLTEVLQPGEKNYSALLRLPFLELLLANEVFINQLDDRQMIEFKRIIVNKYADKVKNSEIYSLYNISHTFLLGAIVLQKQNPQDLTTTQRNTLTNFINNYNRAEPALYTEISRIISAL